MPLASGSNSPEAGSPVPDVLPGSAELARLLAQAEASFRAARAGSTLRAYAHDWKQCRLGAERRRLDPLPASPECVILYATDLTKNEGRRLNTLQRRLAAISQMHQQTGFESPTRAWAVKQFLSGLRRELGVAPTRKRPVLTDDLKQILAEVPDTPLGKRDRALLLLGFAGAFRRSELGGARCRGSGRQPGGPDRSDPEEQDGSGRRGQGSGNPTRSGPVHLPGPGAGGLARGGEDRERAVVSGSEPPRTSPAGAAIRRSGGDRRQALRRTARLRSRNLRRPQSPRRARDLRRRRGQKRARHHEPNRTSQPVQIGRAHV